MQASFDPSSSFAFGNAVHKSLDVITGNSGHSHFAKQQLYVSRDTATVDDQRRCLFRDLPACEEAASLSVSQIHLAQFRHGDSSADSTLLAGGISSLCDLAQYLARLFAGHIGCPRRAMPADCVPPLPA